MPLIVSSPRVQLPLGLWPSAPGSRGWEDPEGCFTSAAELGPAGALQCRAGEKPSQGSSPAVRHGHLKGSNAWAVPGGNPWGWEAIGKWGGDQGGLEAGKEQLPAVFTTGNSVDGEAVSEADRQVGRAREICKIALKMLRSYG